MLQAAASPADAGAPPALVLKYVFHSCQRFADATGVKTLLAHEDTVTNLPAMVRVASAAIRVAQFCTLFCVSHVQRVLFSQCVLV